MNPRTCLAVGNAAFHSPTHARGLCTGTRMHAHSDRASSRIASKRGSSGSSRGDRPRQLTLPLPASSPRLAKRSSSGSARGDRLTQLSADSPIETVDDVRAHAWAGITPGFRADAWYGNFDIDVVRVSFLGS